MDDFNRKKCMLLLSLNKTSSGIEWIQRVGSFKQPMFDPQHLTWYPEPCQACFLKTEPEAANEHCCLCPPHSAKKENCFSH